MTLESAIKHCEEVAEKNEKQASWFWVKEGNPNYEKCNECASEHRQLAEWLRDYKKLKKQEPKTDVLDKIKQVREEIENLTPWDEGTVEMYEVLAILDRLIESEE